MSDRIYLYFFTPYIWYQIKR